MPFVIGGGIDAAGSIWATILAGQPGFINSPDPYHLIIHRLPFVFDPLHASLVSGNNVALLGIEQTTRRRNRINSYIERTTDTSMIIAVKQSFGNCPKYIQARQVEHAPVEIKSKGYDATALNDLTRQIILRADTLFIATAHPVGASVMTASKGIDVSHRGGLPGFVCVDSGNTLIIPDYSGNRYFNTLGNIVLYPRAGILFTDFETDDLLYISADAEIIADGPELKSFAGAERLLLLRIRQVRHVTVSLPLRWSREVEFSPFLLK